MKKNDKHRYDDMIHLPHHVSVKHPPMDRIDRAAQFSPFAALTGFDAAICETARLTERRKSLSDYELAELNERLQWIKEHLMEYPNVTITYFQPDERKAGGTYDTVTNCVKKWNEYKQFLLLKDGTKIPFENIYKIEI